MKRFLQGFLGTILVLFLTFSMAFAEEAQQAAPNTWIDYQPWFVNLPDPIPGQEKGALALVTDFNTKIVVSTTGPIEFTDIAGDQPYFDPRYKSATTLVIVEGSGVLIRAFPKSAWVGITNKPVAGEPLGFGQMSELVNERAAEIFKYQPGTDAINILWVRDGRIYFKGSMPRK